MLLVSISISVIALGLLVRMLRRDGMSFGLPAAYLFSLLLIHVPGAFAHLVGGDFLYGTELTAHGSMLTALGVVSFVFGVWISSRMRAKGRGTLAYAMVSARFTVFCLVGGLLLTFAFQTLERLPSIGAAMDKAGAVWMLAVMLGLRSSVKSADLLGIARWLLILAIYPTFMLLFGGFLSYGAAAAITVLYTLAISVRSNWKVFWGMVAATVLGVNFFLSYFIQRDELREVLWSTAGFEERARATFKVIEGVEWFDPTDESHLVSLDQRLNQNAFLGLAAARLDNDEVDYLLGRSLWEGLAALVPRAIWSDKPVYGGSGQIVAEMTGLVLSDTTSWGVGNVMEFYVNFGVPGVVVGFLLLGFALGFLDRRSAESVNEGQFGRVFLYFLPAIALSNPGGSLVEVFGGAAAAYVAAFFWKWVWVHWGEPDGGVRPVAYAGSKASRG